MSTVKTNNVQVGQSVTATNNGTWYQPATPDGTIRYGIGNAGATTSDVVTLSSSGLSATALIPSGSTAPTNGLFLPTTNTLAWSTNSTERLRLDSSGNLGLGVTPPSGSTNPGLFIGGNQGLYGTSGVQVGFGTNVYNAAGTWKYVATAAATLYQPSSGTHAWYTAPSGTAGNAISFTQAMTLDASGNLLVGTTSRVSNERLVAIATGTAEAAIFSSDGTYATTIVRSTYFSGTRNLIQFRINATDVGNITSAGSTTAYNTSSDQRLKENIVDAPSALSSVNAIKVRSFDWKSDGSHSEYGYIAQELLEVAPEAVSVPANPDEMMGVDFGKLTPRLVKAIQELSAELNELKQKVNA